MRHHAIMPASLLPLLALALATVCDAPAAPQTLSSPIHPQRAAPRRQRASSARYPNRAAATQSTQIIIYARQRAQKSVGEYPCALLAPINEQLHMI